MSKLKTYFINHWPYWVGTSILIAITFYYVFFNASVQLFHYDMMEQGIRFIQRAWDLYREPGFEFWDFNHYFGASIFVHQYMLYSPFWLALVFLPSKALIPYAFLYVNMGKLILLYVFSVFYFSRIRSQKLSIVVGASIMTFGGFTMGYYNYANFTDVFLFLPLVLYSIENYLDHKKTLLLIIGISIMAFINVYLFFLFTPYIFLYTLFRYFSKEKFSTVKSLIIDGLEFMGVYLLSIALVSFIFIPSLELLLESARISSNQSWFRTINFNDAFRYLSSLFQPVVDRNNFNPLVSKFIVPSYGHSGGAAIYSLIITPLLLLQIFFIGFKRTERNGLFILYIFLILISIFPSFYVFLQGNTDTRWMVMFILLNAYSTSLIFDHFETINKKFLVFSWLFVSGFLVISYFYSRRLGLHNVELYYDIAKRNVLVLGVLSASYVVILIFFKNKKIITLLLGILIFVDASFSAFNLFFNPVDSVSMDASELASYQLENTQIIDYIKAYDDSTYRIDAIENYNFNNPLGKNYSGFTFYSNTYNYEVNDFTLNNIASGGGWVVGANASKWQYKTLFSAKYWFDLTYGAQVPFGFRYLDTVNYASQEVDIYENQYFIPMMYFMNQSLNFETWRNLNSLDKFRSMMSSVILEESINTSPIYPNALTKLSDFTVNYQEIFDEIQEDVIVYAVYPRSEEVKMVFKLNGLVVHEFYSYEPHYASTLVSTKFDEIEVNVTNLYGVPEEEFINTLYIEKNLDVYEDWYQNLSEGFVQNYEQGLNEFSGVVESKNEGWVVTTIAYDPDWTVFVNGKKVQVEKVNGGFIGIKIHAGTNSIQASYFPKLFGIGLMISTFALLIVLVLHSKWVKSKISSLSFPKN